jgi:hypothetical protein
VKQSGEIHLVVDCSVEKITQLLKASLYTILYLAPLMAETIVFDDF